MTWQASPRNKFAGTYKQDTWCDCPNGITGACGARGGLDFRFPVLRQVHGEWTSPVTSKLLVEAVGMNLRAVGIHASTGSPGLVAGVRVIAPQMISVTEQSSGLVYRAPVLNNNNTRVPNWTYRAAVAYVTGSHSFKTDSTGFMAIRRRPTTT